MFVLNIVWRLTTHVYCYVSYYPLNIFWQSVCCTFVWWCKRNRWSWRDQALTIMHKVKDTKRLDWLQ
jgi:hypothetical protein